MTDKETPTTPKNLVFIASNGRTRSLGDDLASFGEIVYLAPVRIDPHLAFKKLENQIYSTIEGKIDLTSGECYLALGNCNLTLLLAFSYFSFYGIPVKVLSYDHLMRTYQTYYYSDNSWKTQLTDSSL